MADIPIASENAIHSPYKLQLTIHNGEALPIADITTSDPYITILIGGRLEGRTKTIYRNRNPVWNEEFNLKLLHRRSVVTLKVLDEDRGKDDDMLGTVYIDLTDLPLDQPIKKKYQVIAFGAFDTTASKIEVSVTVKSNESVIQIVPDEVDDASIDDAAVSPMSNGSGLASPMNLSTTSSINPEKVSEVVECLIRENPNIHAAESVVNALTRYITRDRYRFFSEEMLRDLLYDASSLTCTAAEAATLMRSSPRSIYNRTHLRVVNASRLVMSTKVCTWHPPIPKNCLQLNLLPNESKFINIQFYNRLSMWVCTRWLVMLYDFWKGLIKPSELPSWASNCSYTAQCTVVRSDGHSSTGRMVLSFERPFELRINDEHTPFKNLHNLVMSADSMKPKEYTMDIEILSFSATGEFSREDKALLEKEKEEKEAKKGVFGKINNVRLGIRGVVKGAVLGVANGAIGVVSGATDIAVGTTIGVASTAIGAARSVVTGNPSQIIHQAQDDLLSVGKNLRSILKDATSVLGEASTYNVAKFDNVVMKSMPLDHIYVDLNEDSFADRVLRRTPPAVVTPGDSPVEGAMPTYPEMDRANTGVSFLLCHGNNMAQMVIGHKRLTAQILRQKLDQICEIPLNVQLAYGIELINSRGLQLSPPGKMTIGGGGMHVKMKFVDRHGNSKSLGRLKEVKTTSITPTPNPDWHCNATFKAQDGFENATYLRIEVCLDDFTTNFILGSCFIPLILFRKKSKEYTFPMTRFKQTAIHPRDSSVSSCLGETTFRIYRIEEDGNSPAVMVIRPRMIETNIFNTRWYCECVPAGTVNTEHLKDIEEFSLMASMEGLELVGTGRAPAEVNIDQTDIFQQQHSNPSLETLPLSEDWTQGEEQERFEIDVEVFENQRRQPYYPFDWSSKAYTRPIFSDLTYAIGYKFETLNAAAPPENFEWSSEWCLDKSYIETDPQGWVYGFTFGSILSSYKQGKSHTKPVKMMARRRKWVRRAVCTQRASTLGRTAMDQFADANCFKSGTSIHGTSSYNLDTSAHDKNDGPQTPQSPAGRTAHAPVELRAASWRNDFLIHTPNALVQVCQERLTLQSNVIIPWDQVKDAYVVTPSVLSIFVSVHRYMSDKVPTNAGFFRPADIEVFVSNCPAAELKSMIEERKWFNSFKLQIRSLVQSGNSSGVPEQSLKIGDLASVEEVPDSAVPETEELSLGSELVADLDENSIALEARVRELDKYIGMHNTSRDKAALKEKSIILRRDCRLRVYMAALFGVGLQGNHNYVESEVRAIMVRDFKMAQNIKQDNEVATANNRIEYYLDTAEKRIRDAVLCGWNYREEGDLQRTLEIFANGYFIEIVGLLGAFFEDSGKTSVKGLGSKVELINTYLKHNDRLATIIDHALRPYALRAKPSATLSLFLDFDILVSWYTSVLLLEMRERANHVLNVWKDPSKDVTDNNSKYKYSVPWVPLHTEADDTQFFTQIPEDLAEVLITYLQHARIHKDTVAPSFQDSIGRLDAEVLMAYTSSFLYLSEQMTAALDSKDWASATIEDELAEYATWLASVANDAQRVEAHQLHAPNRVADAAKDQGGEEFEDDTQESLNKEAVVEKRTLRSFRRLALNALDHLCCIVFIYIFHERSHLLNDQIYKTWVDTMLDLEGGEETEPIVPAIMEDVTFFLQQKRAFLRPYCYWKLVGLAAEKMYILYLSIFKIAQRYGAVFGTREIKQIREDIKSMKIGLMAALEVSAKDTPEYHEVALSVQERFVAIEHCCELFEHDIASHEFEATMKKIVAISEKKPADAAGLASLVEACLGLKGVSKYSTRKREKAAPRTSVTASSAPPNPPVAPRGSIQSAAPSAAPVAASAPVPVAAVKRRGSMFDSFFGHNSEGQAPAPAQPRKSLPTPEEGARLAQKAMEDSAAEAEAAAERDEEEEEQEMLRMAAEMRDQAMVECIALMIQDIRSHSVHPVRKYTSLTRSSPLERVFGTDYSSEYPLDVQILHSARPPSGKSLVTHTSVFGLGHAFSGLFRSKTKKGHGFGADSNATGPTPQSPLSPEEALESLGDLRLAGLKAENLFYLDTLRAPHPYLKVRFGKFQFTTKVMQGDSADWSSEPPILIPLHGIGTSDSAKTSLSELHISLHYKGFINDHTIGEVTIPFAPYAPPLFVDKRYTIEEFKSPQTATAAKKATAEGRNHPAIILSLSHVPPGST